MSALYPTTMAEKIRDLGTQCHCETCRGSDTDIDDVFRPQQAEIKRQRAEIKRLDAKLAEAIDALQNLYKWHTTANPFMCDANHLRAAMAKALAVMEKHEAAEAAGGTRYHCDHSKEIDRLRAGFRWCLRRLDKTGIDPADYDNEIDRYVTTAAEAAGGES